jgi:ParB-like chromosome segregation protein Spo0J
VSFKNAARPTTVITGESTAVSEQVGDQLGATLTPTATNTQRSPDGGLEFHTLAEIFPLIDGAEFDDLVADIREHGVHEPIWIFDGRILDGRNRYRAAQAAGVDCPLRAYLGDDPAAFVISLNLKRRHLNESQRGMIAAKLANMPDGGNRAEQHSANLHSAAKAADMLNVSERTVKTAKQVQENAAPELIAAVEQGHLAVSQAAKAAALPEDDQREIAAKAKAGDAKAARSYIKEKTPEAQVAKVAEIAEKKASSVTRPETKAPVETVAETATQLGQTTYECIDIKEAWRKPLAETEEHLGIPAAEYVDFLMRLGTAAFNRKFQSGLTGQIELWLVEMHEKYPATFNARAWEGSCGDLSIDKLRVKHGRPFVNTSVAA